MSDGELERQRKKLNVILFLQSLTFMFVFSDFVAAVIRAALK